MCACGQLLVFKPLGQSICRICVADDSEDLIDSKKIIDTCIFSIIKKKDGMLICLKSKCDDRMHPYAIFLWGVSMVNPNSENFSPCEFAFHSNIIMSGVSFGMLRLEKTLTSVLVILSDI